LLRLIGKRCHVCFATVFTELDVACKAAFSLRASTVDARRRLVGLTRVDKLHCFVFKS